jgi:hypothetical protein
VNPVEKFVDAVNTGDLDGVAAVFHPDFEVRRATGGGFKGRDREVENMQAFMTNFPEGRIKILNMLETPSEVWVNNRFITNDVEMGSVVIFGVDAATETIRRMEYLVSWSRRLR